MKIAIIGGGVTGSNILRHILDHKNFRLEDKIYIFENRDFLGPGVPYEKDTPVKMLNVGPRLMSMDRENDDDLKEWLDKNVENSINFEGLISREDYGLYLRDYFKKYYESENVEIIKEAVTDLDLVGEKFKLKTKEYLDIEFDTVFLALGHPDYNDFYDLKGIDNYIHNPYLMEEKLSNLDKDAKIGIIGAGASSVDVFRYLSLVVKPEKTFEFFVINSEITKFPSIPLEDKSKFKFSIYYDWIKEATDKDTGFIALEDALKKVDGDLKEAGVDILESYEKYKDIDTYEGYQKLINEKPYDLQVLHYYFGLISKYHAQIFGLLSKLDQEKYLNKYHKVFDIFFTLVPMKTSQWIIDSINEGKVIFNKGLKEIEHKDGKFVVTGEEVKEVDYLINTTGFNLDLMENAKENILIKNLLNKKIISSQDSAKGINVKWPDSSILSNKYGEIRNLISIGFFQSGLHYMPNGALTMREISKIAVDEYMDEVYLGLWYCFII